MAATDVALRTSVAASIAGKTAELVTLVVLATVVPRALGPTDYGRFAVPLTVVTLASLAMTLGGPTVLARYVPAAAPADRVAVARATGLRLARGRAAQLAGLAVAAAAVRAVVGPGTVLAAVVLDDLVRVALGAGFEGAADAFGPALAVIVLAPMTSLAVQAAALRLRPEAALAAGAASAVVFLAVARAATPAWGAAGGTAATLAGTAAGALVSLRLLPGAIGARLAVASFAGAALVVALA